METTLEKATLIAQEALKEIKTIEGSKEESKDASSVEGKEKVEGSTEQDVQKQEEIKLLAAEDESLTDEQKEQKKVLLQKVEDEKEAKLSPDEKIKSIKEQSQKRIDEIKGELLAERNKRSQDSEIVKKLEAELAEMKKQMQPRLAEDNKAKIDRIAKEQIAKFVEEDKGKSFDQRREMSKEDLESWLLDDIEAATEWITNRTIRRGKDKERLEKEISSNGEASKLANDFVEKQNASLKKLVSKYPDINLKTVNLNDVLWKTDEEVEQLMKGESKNAIMAVKLCNQNPKKYLERVDGPELVMQELDRINNKSKKIYTLTEDELQEKIKEEAERIANLDEGLTSTKGKIVIKKGKQSEFSLKQEEIARKAGMSKERLDEINERRAKIIGVDEYRKDE